jgi:rod shape-determining protein MreD
MTEATRTLLQVFSDASRVALGHGLLLLLTLVLMANWVLPYFSVLKPQLILVAIFYWSLYRPTLMPPWLVFAVGLALDLIHPVMPLGTHAFSYLLIAGSLRPRRRMLMGQPFMMIWVAFMVVVAADLIIKTLALLALAGVGVNVATILINGLSTILAFPVLLMMFVWIHRLLPASRGLIAN